MNKAESKYASTAARMDEALIACLEKKDLAYITVKEICERAGVNRSTFYLHYETVADLLDECVEYTNNKCFQRYSADLTDMEKRLASDRPEDSILISPAYLRPYLEFVRSNKRIYQVVLEHQEVPFSGTGKGLHRPFLSRRHHLCRPGMAEKGLRRPHRPDCGDLHALHPAGG